MFIMVVQRILRKYLEFIKTLPRYYYTSNIIIFYETVLNYVYLYSLYLMCDYSQIIMVMINMLLNWSDMYNSHDSNIKYEGLTIKCISFKSFIIYVIKDQLFILC